MPIAVNGRAEAGRRTLAHQRLSGGATSPPRRTTLCTRTTKSFSENGLTIKS